MIDQAIRKVLVEHGRLAVDVSTIDGEADLYELGLTSHASVNVMLALEDSFDIEFPDELLRKSTFASVKAIEGALTELGCCMNAPQSQCSTGTALERAARLADEVAAVWADEVDAEARFPREAVDAMRSERLLSVAVPRELGGEGLSLQEVSQIARVIGTRCAASGMIFAMHQTQIYSLVKHGNTEALREFVEETVDKQLLLASATTELGIGGDVSRSYCAVEDLGGHLLLIKNAPVISYGEHSDAIVVTARRTPESQPNDQVLVVCRTPDLTLERTTEWNTLGLRGTCSLGYILRATSTPEMVAGVPYSDISTHHDASGLARRLEFGVVGNCRRCSREGAQVRACRRPQAARGHFPRSAAARRSCRFGTTIRRSRRCLCAQVRPRSPRGGRRCRFRGDGSGGIFARDEQPESHSVDSGGGNRGADNVDLWNLGISRGHRIFARSAPS